MFRRPGCGRRGAAGAGRAGVGGGRARWGDWRSPPPHL